MNDNEIRTAMIEIGMPNMGFEALGFCKPTEMERVIFEEVRPPQPYVMYMGLEMKKAFDKCLKLNLGENLRPMGDYPEFK